MGGNGYKWPDGKSQGVVFETTTPFETPGWMKKSVDWFSRSAGEERNHPLILIVLATKGADQERVPAGLRHSGD
jgi:hypothetical protein